jgi:predicted nucleic acid-binding protein
MDDPMITVWWGTPVECCSAFARLRREGVFDVRAEQNARAPLRELMKVWAETRPSEDIREQAIRLISVHPLRSADSLQLAAAIMWAGRNPKDHTFVCLDERLREAAHKEGFEVLPSRIQV